MIRTFIKWNRGAAAWLEDHFPAIFTGESRHQMMFDMIVDDLKDRDEQVQTRVLEVGSADRPFLSKHERIIYDGLDIDKTPACNVLYDHFFQQSINEPLPNKYDIILSRTMIEHLPDVRSALESMYVGLRPGGSIYHYYPCKNHPYALILRLVGNRMQQRLIRWFDPDSVGVTGHRVYFDHCSYGESLYLLHDVGYREIVIQPFYRANRYFNIFLPAYLLVTLFENICKRFNLTQFCSGIIVGATKEAT